MSNPKRNTKRDRKTRNSKKKDKRHSNRKTRKKLEIGKEEIATQILNKRYNKELANHLNINLFKESKEFILDTTTCLANRKKNMKIEPINSTFENNLLFYLFFYYLIYLFRFYINTKIQNTFINILHKKFMRLKEKKYKITNFLKRI